MATVAGMVSLILIAVSSSGSVSTIHVGDFADMQACAAARDAAKSFVPRDVNLQFATICIPSR